MNQRFAQDNDERMRIQRTTSRTGYETCLFTKYRSTPVSLRLRRQKHDDALHSKYHIASKPVPRFRGTRLAHELIRPKLGTCRVRFIERQRSLFAAVMPVFSWASGLFGMGAGQYSSSPWGTSAKSDILRQKSAATTPGTRAKEQTSFLRVLAVLDEAPQLRTRQNDRL